MNNHNAGNSYSKAGTTSKNNACNIYSIDTAGNTQSGAGTLSNKNAGNIFSKAGTI